MTQEQQAIIESLNKEFTRINEQRAAEKRGFNLIDINPLKAKSEEIARQKELELIDKEHWEQLCLAEADRIVKLLREDLPMLRVERHGEPTNGFSSVPRLFITRKGENTLPHHDERLGIEINYCHNYVQDEWLNNYKRGICLQYKADGHAYFEATLEQALKRSEFSEQIRKRFLS
jgi:hypothetical protein